MRRHLGPTSLFAGTVLAGVLSASVAAAAPGSESEAKSIEAAQRFERGLEKDTARLRLRTNLEHLIALWESARAHAKKGDRLTALEGEARARKMLAHWSGRKDDQERAAEARTLLDKELKRSAAPIAPAASTAVARLSAVAFEEAPDGPRLVLAVEGEFEHKRHRIAFKDDRAARVVFDLRPVVAANKTLKSITVKKNGIDRIRVGQFDDKTVRIVVDVEKGSSAPKGIDLVRDGTRGLLALGPPEVSADERKEAPSPAPVSAAAEQASEAPSEDKDDALAATRERLLEIVQEMKSIDTGDPAPARDASPRGQKESSAIAASEAESVEEEPAGGPGEVAIEARALKRSTRDAAKARDEGLVRIQRIVLDAGHGGKDFGAQGVNGIREKDVNLAIAKKLGKQLEKRLGVKVVYTRSSDQFVSLQRRAQIANKSSADLFVSIHANAHKRRSIAGIETYYLNTTSDRYAERLARRENAGPEGEGEPGDDPEPGVGMSEEEGSLPSGELGQDLRLILADLAMRSASTESRRLAGYVQSTLVGTLKKKHGDIRDLGVKHALFYVLLGARMPSILVETGFVTNSAEGGRLGEAQYQSEAASAIALGIARFVHEREGIARRLRADGGAVEPRFRDERALASVHAR